MYIPRIGITIGGINGIGPELIIKVLKNADALTPMCTPVVFASSLFLETYAGLIDEKLFPFISIKKGQQIVNKKINVVETWNEELLIHPGQSSEILDKYSTLSILEACKSVKAGMIDGILTAPVQKCSIVVQNKSYSGHTELLRALFENQNLLMVMATDECKVALLTEHIALKKVAENITLKRLLKTLKNFHKTLEDDFNIIKPKIAVLGLNPHAGDNKIIGHEDADIISPAIHEAKIQNGIMAFGPYSSDGFWGFQNWNAFDGILAMYHDQGLIPFKMQYASTGVNYTAGLPFVRTSPDHGTAMDIAGQGVADTSSFLHALYMCIDIVRNRKNINQPQEPAS